jgi:hypothetical protein
MPDNVLCGFTEKKIAENMTTAKLKDSMTAVFQLVTPQMVVDMSEGPCQHFQWCQDNDGDYADTM